MKLICFVLLACVSIVFSRRHHSPRHASDPHWSLLKRVFKGRQLPSAHEGSPLYLTPFIEDHKFKKARVAAAVNNTHLLPGLESYAGYLTVNKIYNSNVWFWYFPVQGKPVESTPWIIWLQGGPGSSSLFGLFNEIGPLVFKDGNLEECKYSWGKNFSLLFIDNPVGTGFSFTENDQGYSTNQTQIGENLYNMVQQFLSIFPELRKAPLTIAGESYAGKHVPSLGIQIHRNKNAEQPINLQKISIGNGWIDPITLQRYSFFAREVGIVDDAVADAMRQMEIEAENLLKEDKPDEALQAHYDVLGGLVMADLINPYNLLSDEEPSEAYVDFVQRAQIRDALHVGDREYSHLSYLVYDKLKDDNMNSAKMWLEELLDNYSVLLYSGHLDVVVPYHASVNTYLSMKFDGAAEYRNGTRLPWTHGGVLAGYYKSAGNLLEVMVRGAGHMVPIDKPSPALGLITAFLQGIHLNIDTGYLVA